MQRETSVRIAEAHSAQAAAERETREQGRRADTEAEQHAHGRVLEPDKARCSVCSG